MKTAELTGAALDWAVAKCEGFKVPDGMVQIKDGFVVQRVLDKPWSYYSPSTAWAQGGPIIEREVSEVYWHDALEMWAAKSLLGDLRYGSTLLVAAMRCYVACKLGDEVEVPKKLIRA